MGSTVRKASFADVMASERNKPRTATDMVCFSSELAEEYQAHLIAAEAARSEGPRRSSNDERENRRLSEKPQWRVQLELAAKLVEDHPESFYDVTLVKLRDSEWLRLRSEHLPRENSDLDKGSRWNVETFPAAVLAASLVDPEPTEEHINYLLEMLSHGELARIAMVAWNLNESTNSIPKVDQLSRLLENFVTS